MQRRVEATYGERARPGVALLNCPDQDGVCSQVRAWEVVCGHARDGRGQGLGVWWSDFMRVDGVHRAVSRMLHRCGHTCQGAHSRWEVGMRE